MSQNLGVVLVGDNKEIIKRILGFDDMWKPFLSS